MRLSGDNIVLTLIMLLHLLHNLIIVGAYGEKLKEYEKVQSKSNQGENPQDLWVDHLSFCYCI